MMDIDLTNSVGCQVGNLFFFCSISWLIIFNQLFSESSAMFFCAYVVVVEGIIMNQCSDLPDTGFFFVCFVFVLYYPGDHFTNGDTIGINQLDLH